MALVTVIPGTFAAPGLPTLGIKGFTDTFTRPDAATLGSTEGLPSRAWQAWVTSGTPASGITNNEAYLYRVEGASHALATVNAETPDGTLTVTMGTAATNAQFGPVFRAVDARNYWRLVNAQGAEYRLQKFVGGTLTRLDSGFGVTPAQGDVIDIEMSGSAIRVTINAAEVGLFTDAEHSEATRHGFYNNTQGSTIRDVTFTAA